MCFHTAERARKRESERESEIEREIERERLKVYLHKEKKKKRIIWSKEGELDQIITAGSVFPILLFQPAHGCKKLKFSALQKRTYRGSAWKQTQLQAEPKLLQTRAAEREDEPQ